MGRGGRLLLLYFFLAGVAVMTAHLTFVMRIVVIQGVIVFGLFQDSGGRARVWDKILAFACGVVRARVPYSFWPATPAFLLAWRSALEAHIARVFPAPESSFIQGLLLGNSGTLDYDFVTALRATGLTHIVALSGYNISIVLQASRYIVSSLWWSMSLIGVFIIFTGASSSVVRAGVMGCMASMYRHMGKVQDFTWVMTCTACVMVALDPQVLLFNIGFALSFLATIGVRCGSRWRIFSRFPNAIRATLGATLFTTPLLVVAFGRLSLISPLANVLIVPMVPFLMLLAAVGVVCSYFSSTFAPAVVLPVVAGFHAVVMLIIALSKLPYASV